MPRDVVQTACKHCRKKRSKCDGQIPCQRCEDDGELCSYDYNRRESKDKLRAEIERLKNINEENQKLLSDLASDKEYGGYQTAFKRSTDRSRSHEKDFKEEEGSNYSAGPSRTAKRRQRRASSTTSNEKLADSPCFGQLRSWKSCYPRFDDDDLSGNTTNRATSWSLPPLPLDAYTSHSQTDTWTQTGWTRAHIHHLFDALFTWEYLPFSLLTYDLFLRDFHSGSTRFCSSTLVHAILALATRLVNEKKDDTGVPSSGWLRSKIFFDEAKSEVQNGGSLSDRLPDIQALGILSLYEFRCGQEVQAQTLAQEFLTSITEYCQRKSTMGEEGDVQYTRVRTSTYCGAVSLSRILPLTTGQLFDARSYELQEDLSILNHLSSDIGETMVDNSSNSRFTAITHSSPLLKYQTIMRMVFQLTEWVHKIITSVQPGIQLDLNDVEVFYTKCLEWYESMFAILNSEGSRSPFALFVHMYYHFGLLCAFRPFISIPVGHPNIQPYHICKQSAQSILALAQSYDDLFTLRRVSALIPYFVCTSGLFSLALEGEGSPLDNTHLRLGDPLLNTAQLQEYNSVATSHYGYPTTPSYFEISATVHASLLLAKMSSTHPAASLAQKALGEANEESDLEMRG